MIYLLGIVVRTWLGFAAPTTPSATTVLNKVQKFYAGIQQLTATFGQKVTNQAFGMPTESAGKVYLTKPGRMRWDYSDKKGKGVKKSFISNGTYLYVVEHDNKQVMKKNLKNDVMPVAVTFLTGKGNLSSEFNAEVENPSAFGAKDDIVLKLTPKTASAQYKSLHLVVAKDDYHVKKSIVTDSSDNMNEISFYKPDTAKSVDKKWFELDPRTVKDYRVIDADQQSPPAVAPSNTR